MFEINDTNDKNAILIIEIVLAEIKKLPNICKQHTFIATVFHISNS